MTKRGIIAVAASIVAICAVSAPVAVAQSPLSAKQAKKLAHDLGQKQKRKNDVVVYHVEDMKRVNDFTIKFAYDERTKSKTFCTAVLRVQKEQTGNTIQVTAQLLRHRCKVIPADVLAVERATRKADRAVRGDARKTQHAVGQIARALDRCTVLKNVPKNRRGAVSAVLDSSINGALLEPNDATLGSYAAALQRVKTSNDTLLGAVEGWADTVDVMRSLPSFPKPCETVRTWKNAGWKADESPIDMAQYRALRHRGRVDSRAIVRGAEYLLRAGMFRKLVVAFTPEGLVTRFAQTD
jgi:hypothetical protein